MRRRIATRYGVAALLVAAAGLVGGPRPRAAEASTAPASPHGTYAEECGLCHRPEGWRPVRISRKFDHAKSGFALEGAHAQAACVLCHVSLEFVRVKPQTDCVGCHEDVHQGEFGQDCARCHTPRSFIDRARMVRAHDLTRFPLAGAHRIADCETCHRSTSPGDLSYVALSTECVSCHREDYNTAANPSHTGGNFPLDCARCHSTIAWRPARFPDHDGLYFPIFSGTHRGRWTACSDCHVNASNFSQFECIQCHAHDDPVETAGHHSGVTGYSYVSTACYGCHPDGRH